MLFTTPTRDELSRLYHEFSKIGARSVGEKRPWKRHIPTPTALVSLAVEWSRHDPRLFQVLTEYFLSHWRSLDAVALRSAYYEQIKTPQVVAVVAEFVKAASELREVILLMDYLQADLNPVPFQLFFINLYPVGSIYAFREASESLAEYKKWGFLSRERPIVDSLKRKNIGTIPSRARAEILERLVRARGERGSIAIGNYLEALSHSISRQQAYYDLCRAKFLKCLGKGRGSRWQLR